MAAGTTWELVEGLDEGQTQVNAAEEGDLAVWSHPIDLHYVARVGVCQVAMNCRATYIRPEQVLG